MLVKMESRFKLIICILFVLGISFSLVFPVFSAVDEYDNQFGFSIYETIGYDRELVELITEENYVENTTYAIDESFDVSFGARTYINETLTDYANLTFTVAIGFQYWSSSTTWAEPLTPILPTYKIDNFWYLIFLSPTFENDFEDETVLCNATLWLDYHNGTGWQEVAQRVFRIENIEGTGYTPTEYDEDVINFKFLWFWCFVFSLFGSGLFLAGAIKMLSPSFFVASMLTIVATIGFYILML